MQWKVFGTDFRELEQELEVCVKTARVHLRVLARSQSWFKTYKMHIVAINSQFSQYSLWGMSLETNEYVRDDCEVIFYYLGHKKIVSTGCISESNF